MSFPTIWYVPPAKPQISLRIRAVWSKPLLFVRIFDDCKLLTEQNLEFLSLKGGCLGSSVSTLVKMSHCWKSHIAAHIVNTKTLWILNVCIIIPLVGPLSITNVYLKCHLPASLIESLAATHKMHR